MNLFMLVKSGVKFSLRIQILLPDYGRIYVCSDIQHTCTVNGMYIQYIHTYIHTYIHSLAGVKII